MTSPLRRRGTIVMFVCAAVAGVLLLRAGWIQIGGDERIERLSRRQFSSKVLIKPPRGAILDRNGEPLAINTETRSLAMNPSKIVHRRLVARLLSKALDLPYSRIYEKISDEKKEFAWIKRHIEDAEFDRLKKARIIQPDGDLISGIWVVNEIERAYTHGELASHVLGGVNLDTEGTEGVELWKDRVLSGKVVSLTAVKDALGRPAFIDSSTGMSAEDAKSGDPVTLTLDATLQFAVENELRDSVTRTGAKAGTAIVMNAMTGEILAMANQPSFNPNFRDVPADRKRNRALTDGYEPGSTMKPVLLTAALLNGMHLTDQIWGERGHFKVQGHVISESEAHERFEWLSLKKIIQVSSNVGAAKLALKLGADRYMNALKTFGFGEKTGIGFPGEISGRVPSRGEWQPITLANIGFGHGVMVTPLQMIRAYAAFLNGGWLVRPKIIQSDDTEQPKRIFSEKIAAQLLETLESTTQTKEGGTGGGAVLEGYRVAGKTGTAQKVDPVTHRYSRTKHLASFIGFPLQVEPKIVIFASLDEPRGNYFGGAVAAPLFKRILNATATRFSLPAPIEQRKLASTTRNRSDAIVTTQSAVVVPEVPATLESLGTTGDVRPAWKMPALAGLTALEAVEVLQGHSIKLEARGEGLIREQSPAPGRPIHEGETVRLSLAEAPE